MRVPQQSDHTAERKKWLTNEVAMTVLPYALPFPKERPTKHRFDEAKSMR